MPSVTEYLNRKHPLIVDGAMGTELERQGCDINDPLWSARILADAPETIAAVHRAYLEAGADILITASYQATCQGFMARGMGLAAAERLIGSAVTLARETVDRFWAVPANREGRPRPLVAASVGPYGAFLADGSEFRGNYGLGEQELMDFHRRRLEILLEAGPDLLACETIPCLAEARALARLLEERPGIPAWFSFSARDDLHISNGERIRDCAQWLDTRPEVAAVGINCTAPRHISSLIREIRSATAKPVVVYPNKGGIYDPLNKTWAPDPSLPSFDRMAREWEAQGAGLIGGCCQTSPRDIRLLAAGFKSKSP